MTDREKLIELLGKDTCKHDCCLDCEHNKDNDTCITYLKSSMADLLLANGVTFANGTNVPSWISVSERLPDEEELVLILCKNGARFVGWCGIQYGDFERRWHIKTALNSSKLLNKGRVTHWMPLPEPPEEDGNEQ